MILAFSMCLRNSAPAGIGVSLRNAWTTGVSVLAISLACQPEEMSPGLPDENKRQAQTRSEQERPGRPTVFFARSIVA